MRRTLTICFALLAGLAACGEERSCKTARCVANKTCACLDGQGASFNLELCLQSGGCVSLEDTLQVTCPGG